MKIAAIALLVIMGIACNSCLLSPVDGSSIYNTPSPTFEGDEGYYEIINSDKVWISPGEFAISNYYPGAIAQCPLRIHNGSDDASRFTIEYRMPNKLTPGYQLPPADAYKWVTIVEPEPLIAAKETREIIIRLEIPEKAVVNQKQWEFWIVTRAGGQGSIQTENGARCLVKMR